MVNDKDELNMYFLYYNKVAIDSLLLKLKGLVLQQITMYIYTICKPL